MKRPKNRAERRIAKKRKEYFVDKNFLAFSSIKRFCEHEYSFKLNRKLAKTPKPCSCYLCGNPRKFYNARTLKEIVAINELKHFFENYEENFYE